MFITQILLFHILFLAQAKAPPLLKNMTQKSMVIPSGHMIKAYLAKTMEEQERGLSGTKDKDFGPQMAMIFIYKETKPQRFWMPDTYFDLDIFFLNKEMIVIDVDRKVPHHPGRNTPPKIANTRTIMARHVLEMRADSPVSQKIKKGTKIILLDQQK